MKSVCLQTVLTPDSGMWASVKKASNADNAKRSGYIDWFLASDRGRMVAGLGTLGAEITDGAVRIVNKTTSYPYGNRPQIAVALRFISSQLGGESGFLAHVGSWY